MLRIDVLDQKNSTLLSKPLREREGILFTIGSGSGASMQVAGDGIAPLHVAIDFVKSGQHLIPIVMDLGGKAEVKLDGNTFVEQTIANESSLLEIGTRKIRLVFDPKTRFEDIKALPIEPLSDGKTYSLQARIKVFKHDHLTEYTTVDREFAIAHPIEQDEMVTILKHGSKNAWTLTLPLELSSLKGRVRVGREQILPLDHFTTAQTLEVNTPYRVQITHWTYEILITDKKYAIGLPRPELFPKELRKPTAISVASVAIVFALWMLTIGKPKPEIEEPYQLYARVKNVPLETIPEEPSAQQQAGGGSGSPNQVTTAPTKGEAASSVKTSIASSLTGGLKNLVGSLTQNKQPSDPNLVITDSGVAGAAARAGGGLTTSGGKIAMAGTAQGNIAGASNLGKLSVGGKGTGFGGGSGTGLGTGVGSGIGAGSGEGIGRGGFRLVEEESVVDGGLDKSVIAAVIQNNLGQIKYCYERQLVADPNLFGKVVVKWIINSSGTVEGAAVKQSTMNSNPVEQCMVMKISGWQFPQPKNGSKVTVTYPFLFKSTK